MCTGLNDQDTGRSQRSVMVVKSGNQPMAGDYYQNRYGTKEIDVSIPLVGCFCCQIPGL